MNKSYHIFVEYYILSLHAMEKCDSQIFLKPTKWIVLLDGHSVCDFRSESFVIYEINFRVPLATCQQRNIVINTRSFCIRYCILFLIKITLL